MYQITTLKNSASQQLVHDVVLHPLKVNADPRGTLTETLKTTWEDVYNPQDMPFTQMYYSVTKPETARDIDHWHFHPGGQQDRFGVISGDIVVGIYDNRDDSPTKGTLNLFAMGQSQGPEGQYLLVVPKRTYHGYVVVSDSDAIMFNYPSRLYDPAQEHRLLFADYQLSDGTVFNWQKVVAAYKEI